MFWVLWELYVYKSPLTPLCKRDTRSWSPPLKKGGWGGDLSKTISDLKKCYDSGVEGERCRSLLMTMMMCQKTAV